MSNDVRQFVIDALEDMHFDVSQISDETPLGEDGVDIESLSVAELALRVEEMYRVAVSDDDMEQIPKLTLGELVVLLSARVDAPEVGSAVE